MSDTLNFTSGERINQIRDKNINVGLDNLKSKLASLEIELKEEKTKVELPKPNVRYKGTEAAEMARSLYHENIKAPEKKDKEDEGTTIPNTIASRAHTRALSRALVGLRNGGDVGKSSPPAGPNGGNSGGIVIGTTPTLVATMSVEEYQDYITNKFIKEEDEVEEVEEPKQDFLTETAVDVLEKRLLKLEDLSWQSIDKVMREIAKENAMTPKQLHKDFKSKHGMIPDEWAKENQMTEQVGWFPLDEMVRVNKIGQVFEVTFLFRGGRQRLKFFWPEVGYPSHDEMQKACQKFWPGARLIAYYPSLDPGDNQSNFMVIVPPLSENFNLIPDDMWEFMSEEDTEVYDEIAAEVGEPVSPVYLTEEGLYVMDVENHDTGDVIEVIFGSGLSEDDMKGMSVKSGHKRSVNQGAGLTQKGVEAYRRKNPGSKLKTAVTTPPSKLKPGSKAANRRKSFCARSRSWNGERGKAARRRWNC